MLDAVETKQARFCPQPQITVGGLSNRGDFAFRKTIANLPRRVSVLADVEVRVQRERTRATRQQQKSACEGERDDKSSSARFLHGLHILSQYVSGIGSLRITIWGYWTLPPFRH